MRAFLALTLIASPAAATSLKDFWQSRPVSDPHFQSAKSSAALEECISLDLSEKLGPPIVIHGDGETLVTGVTHGPWLNKPIAGVRIVDNGSSRQIDVGAIHGGGWRNTMSAIVQGCIQG